MTVETTSFAFQPEQFTIPINTDIEVTMMNSADVATLLLLKSLADYVTGQTFTIEGGLMMNRGRGLEHLCKIA